MLPTTLNAFPPPPGLSVDFFPQSRLFPSLLPLKQDVVGLVGTVLWVLMGGIGMVLLIRVRQRCHLLLVRTEGRQHELAFRSALGGTRRRIAAQLLLESSVLGLLGGKLGLGFTYVALHYLVRLAPAGLPRMDDIGFVVRSPRAGSQDLMKQIQRAVCPSIPIYRSRECTPSTITALGRWRALRSVW